MNLETIPLLHAICVGIGFVALDCASPESTRGKRALYTALAMAVAVAGHGDELLAYCIAVTIARAASHPASPTAPNLKLMGALSLVFFAQIASGPFPADDLRTWIWPAAALLVRAALPAPAARPSAALSATEAGSA
jgi:hypothetical protein